ncbi:MAG: glycoside hydrolase family 127 protein [Armatimonadaceae bacterium]
MFVVDTSASPFARLRPVGTESVRLSDSFWEPRREINRNTTLPTQFHHIEETGRLDNFRRASGKRPDLNFQGIFFNDSDVYKWLEAAVAELPQTPALQEMVDTTITEIADAQQEDGYLNTYFMFDKAGERWQNLAWMHELYCGGHFLQAAVAHYRSTRSEKLLDVARRLADHMYAVFGPDGRVAACGHEEAELALVELYRTTNEPKYLTLAQRMVDARGAETSNIEGKTSFDRRYMQDHVPFRELDEVTGHAVRMMYLSAGATDIYLETGEQALWDALDKQWANMTDRRMYVSGGLGARYEGEAFGKDYELPNARAYTETCAAIGSVMWNHRMLLASGDARFADLIEHTLYNAVLPGLSLNGAQYFYQNPLENDGTHRRQAWFGCACCPPNVARLLSELPGYFYSTSDTGAIYVHLYAAGNATITLPDGRAVNLTVETRYPWNGEIKITVQGEGDFALNLRIPSWAGGAALSVDGAEQAITEGYTEIRRSWSGGEVVTLNLPFDVRRVRSHRFVAENNGRCALFRGPLLYCVEAVDNTNFGNLHDIVLPEVVEWLTTAVDDLPGIVGINGIAGEDLDSDESLYHEESTALGTAEMPVTLVPYYAWANREAGQMLVWLREEN